MGHIGLKAVESLTTRCMSELGLRVNDAPQEQRKPFPGPPASLSPSTRGMLLDRLQTAGVPLSCSPDIVVIMNLKGRNRKESSGLRAHRGGSGFSEIYLPSVY